MSTTEGINRAIEAAQLGHAAQLRELLESAPELANTENSEGLYPLGYAAHFGHADAVQVLLDQGAQVNAISHSNVPYIPSNTALHAALAGERDLDVIRLLLKHGANPNLLDSNGHTCLHVAAYHVDRGIEIITLLKEHGADVNARTEAGVTPLTIALEKDNQQMAAILREHGALEV